MKNTKDTVLHEHVSDSYVAPAKVTFSMYQPCYLNQVSGFGPEGSAHPPSLPTHLFKEGDDWVGSFTYSYAPGPDTQHIELIESVSAHVLCRGIQQKPYNWRMIIS